jgi:hypothetical protein
MLHKIILFIFLSSTASTSAFASIFIEPFIGYGFGSNTKINNYSYAGEAITDNGEYSGGTGVGYGGRAGYQLLGIFGGVNYLHRNFNFGNESFSSSTDSMIDELGLIVGYQFPILLKAYFGKNLSASGTFQHRSGKLEMSDGGGTFFGVGFTGLPFIHINFEYHKGYFGEQDNSGLISGKKTDYNYLFLAVSLPFHFF